MVIPGYVLVIAGVALFLLLAWFLVHAVPHDDRHDPFFGDRD